MVEWIECKSEVVTVERNCLEVSELMKSSVGKVLTTDSTHHFIHVVQTSSLGSQLEVRSLKLCDHLSNFRGDGRPCIPRLPEGFRCIRATDG